MFLILSNTCLCMFLCLIDNLLILIYLICLKKNEFSLIGLFYQNCKRVLVKSAANVKFSSRGRKESHYLSKFAIRFIL